MGDHSLLALLCHSLVSRHSIDLYFKREVCETKQKVELVSDYQNDQEAFLVECLYT